ncbi:hypothetical protein KKC83_06745 [Patescibacteria group bacterium]|nr:hypothetical protein [Patescibacteria group bacterium]MBU4015275.1 hypothetical protein [Patescibacteria group bacterium]MBU4027211.1 hypothetical protein [Patescibacteria group bacterium]MBU4073390.1 hypothetical protein [Patescibacteria group bacterium]MBU4102967.1 hypothetical protein [Patescibacteria group bacterium]
MGKICHVCKKPGKKEGTHVDRTSNPNRPVVFHRYNCATHKCQKHKQHIGDEDIRGKY